MIAVWTACVMIAWAPAWNYVLDTPVLAHYLYEADLPGVIVWNPPEATVCRPAFDVPVDYSVAGIHSSQGVQTVGPRSGTLTLIWPSGSSPTATPVPTATSTATPTATPVSEPEPWQMFLGGYVLLMLLFWRWRRG